MWWTGSEKYFSLPPPLSSVSPGQYNMAAKVIKSPLFVAAILSGAESEPGPRACKSNFLKFGFIKRVDEG